METLDPNKVERIVLIDKRWPEAGKSPQAHHQTVEHIIGREWPITLTIRKQNIKKGREHRMLSDLVFSAASGPVALLSVHLCGGLSCKAVDMFNDNPKVALFALKPCCLPGKRAVRQRAEWCLGGHRFTAEELYQQCKPVPDSTGSEEQTEPQMAGAATHPNSTTKRKIKRSAEAIARRREKRKLILANRKKKTIEDNLKEGRLSTDVKNDTTKISSLEQGITSVPDDGEDLPVDRTCDHAREQPPVPFKTFCEHLLKGITVPGGSDTVLSGTHEEANATVSKSIENIKVQHRYFQNTFVFATRSSA